MPQIQAISHTIPPFSFQKGIFFIFFLNTKQRKPILYPLTQLRNKVKF